MLFETITMKDSSTFEIPIVQNYRDCLMLIRSDLYRENEKVFSLWQIITRMILHPCSKESLLAFFRLCKHRKGLFFFFFRRMYHFSSFMRHCDIPYTTKVGFGFYIGHGICIIINSGTIIGNNVNVSQFLNIGTNNKTPAIIGNNVYIAPMTTIVEDVEIGFNAIVGAGAVVTKDVPANHTVAGVPAKIISDKSRKKWHYWDYNRK